MSPEPEPSDRPTEPSSLAAGLLEMVEGLGPVIDAADGFRKQLEERGWSPTAAEAGALEMLQGMLRMAFR